MDWPAGYPLTAVCAPVLWIVWVGTSSTFYNGQSTEAIATTLDLLAYALFLNALLRCSVISALAAGCCFFGAVSFRIPFGLHLLAYGPLLVLTFRVYGTRVLVALTIAFFSGAMIDLVLLGTHAILIGYASDLLNMLKANLAYASFSRVSMTKSLGGFHENVYQLACENRSAVLLPFITAVTVYWSKGYYNQLQRLIAVSCICWLSGALVGVFPGGRHFRHYYHGVWAPLAILSSQWLTLIATSPQARKLATQLMFGLLIAIPGMASVERASLLVISALCTPLRPSSDVREVIDLIERNTSRTEEVPIYTWGNKWAELYWRAPRSPVANCLAPFLFSPHESIAHQPDRYHRWVVNMITFPPRYVLIGETNLNPCVSASDVQPDADFVKMREMLVNSYRVVMKRDGLLVLHKK